MKLLPFVIGYLSLSIVAPIVVLLIAYLFQMPRAAAKRVSCRWCGKGMDAQANARFCSRECATSFHHVREETLHGVPHTV